MELLMGAFDNLQGWKMSFTKNDNIICKNQMVQLILLACGVKLELGMLSC